jgi:hypothetical protein
MLPLSASKAVYTKSVMFMNDFSGFIMKPIQGVTSSQGRVQKVIFGFRSGRSAGVV